jgi:septal ring factor EnvC (AmiA/AmiB activator)
MSRAALLIICDFLLISLLSMAKFDKAAQSSQPRPPVAGLDARAVTNLIETMKRALEQERSARTATEAQLSEAERELKNREQLLAQREYQVRKQEDTLAQIEARARRLARERERLRQEAEQSQQQLSTLQQRQAEAQKHIQELSANLRVTAAEASITKSQAEAIRAELAARRAEVAKLQQQIEKLDESRRAVEQEKQKYAIQLTKVQTEASIVREQLQESRKQVQSLNVEKAELRQHATTLAQGVSALAEESQKINTTLNEGVKQLSAQTEDLKKEIKTEIVETQPKAPNTIFSEYRTNRLGSAFLARRPGLFGKDIRKERGCHTILFRNGTNVFALYHLEDTPLGLWGSGADWKTMTASLGRGLNHFPLRELWLTGVDPRVVLAPLDSNVVTNLRVKVYALAKDPFRYQQAVVVGVKRDYYGEVDFQLDPANPVYLKMKHKPIGGMLSGKLPARGDLVFTKRGELLGLMVNDDYCVVLQPKPPAVTRRVRLGPNVAGQRTSRIVTELWTRLQGLPMKKR